MRRRKRGAWRGVLHAAMLPLAAASIPAPAHARIIALLIGIGHFDGVGLEPGHRDDHALDGPPLDVAAMRRVIEERMGARPEDVHVLLDHQASRANIRAELAGLVARSQPGDTVVIYYSGHGTSARDSSSETGLPLGTSAWIPADFDWSNPRNIAARLVSGRLDIRPLALEPLDRGGRRVILLSDSCFSGNIARGIRDRADGMTSKYVPLGEAADGSDGLPAAVKATDFTPPPYPYRHVLMLSASADTEKAFELSHDRAVQTIDGKPKGALTDALLRIFAGQTPADYDGDGKVSFVELRRAVIENLAAKRVAQSPQLLPSLDQDAGEIAFEAVPGAPGVPVPSRAERLGVAVDASAGPLLAALRSAGQFDLGSARAEMTVARSGSADRFTLSNSTGDLIAREVSGEAIVTRLRAAAWARQIVRGAGVRGAALAADTQPTARGGNFLIGRDSLQFAVKAARPSWYLAFDIDPAGRLITLWPSSSSENRAAPAGTLQTFGKTLVTDPEGLDQVVVLAFSQAPAGIETWFGLNAAFGSAEADAFAQWLAEKGGNYVAVTIDVRTIRPCRPSGAASCGS